ncbi:hypothetical protein AB0H42_06025 [Nocardia sp. NPDC050799]|uniref:hypothetical protein n=1 Tax=Nocardia sp. NPDC050799 TaxID=3154842 RepID=UPI0033D01BB8
MSAPEPVDEGPDEVAGEGGGHRDPQPAAGQIADIVDRATPLIAATKNRATAAARALVEAGADVDAKDDLQDSAYLYAGAEGINDILELTSPTAPTCAASTATTAPRSFRPPNTAMSAKCDG